MKKLQKFCRLGKYLEQIDKELYQVFDDLCLLHLLKASRQNQGITFIYPAKKEYRDKIIQVAYSKKPEDAVLMLKSLVILDYYPDPSYFGTEVINALNQRIIVEEKTDTSVVLEKGLKLEKDEKFDPMENRNIAVYKLVSKGEIPTDRPRVEYKNVQMPVVKGGHSSAKQKLRDYLMTFGDNVKEQNNVFVKKAYLHMKLLADKNVPLDVLKYYIGNDEFSTSFLLDWYCEENCPECFCELAGVICDDKDSRIMKITFENYESMREQLLGPELHNNNNKPASRVEKLKTPIDVRMKVFEMYKDQKKLGRDLFIVFCNLSRDLWEHEYNGKETFENWMYNCANVYCRPSDIVLVSYNVASDLTLYGNLLKSDVFMFEPQARFRSTDVTLPIPNDIPSPMDYNLFSLCGYINKLRYQKKGGAKSKYADVLLGDL